MRLLLSSEDNALFEKNVLASWEKHVTTEDIGYSSEVGGGVNDAFIEKRAHFNSWNWRILCYFFNPIWPFFVVV